MIKTKCDNKRHEYILLRTDGTRAKVVIPKERFFDTCFELLNCGVIKFINGVVEYRGKNHYVEMIIGEQSLLDDATECNFLASRFYGGYIRGNVIIAESNYRGSIISPKGEWEVDEIVVSEENT